MVQEALGEYEFFLRASGYRLYRRRGAAASVERMVDGRWIKVRCPSSFGEPGEGWEKLDAEGLYLHVRRYLIVDLDGETMRWRTDFSGRLRRSRFSRWVLPPLKGGSSRRLTGGAADRSRSAFAELLPSGDETEAVLVELKEQALRGYEHQRERGAETERRANFFLGAAGLTTSLVLANAGLLLGAKLHAPLRTLAAISLGVASVCAIAAGFRAMQAMMISFFRTPPNGVDRVLDRCTDSSEVMVRSYIAALLVAQGRAGAIGDWKVNRLGGARRWFVGAITGVMLLTVFVLAEAL